MFNKVLVPVDVAVTEDARRLLEAAKTLTKDWQCELHVITVIPNVGMAIVGSYFDETFETESQQAAQKELASLLDTTGLEAHQHVMIGHVYDGIISLANQIDADLIVVGAHQPELRSYLLGANAARIVRHSKQSVLVIRDTD